MRNSRGYAGGAQALSTRCSDESPAVFGDDIDVHPAQPIDQLGPTDVMHVAVSISAVLITVVLEADIRTAAQPMSMNGNDERRR